MSFCAVFRNNLTLIDREIDGKVLTRVCCPSFSLNLEFLMNKIQTEVFIPYRKNYFPTMPQLIKIYLNK